MAKETMKSKEDHRCSETTMRETTNRKEKYIDCGEVEELYMCVVVVVGSSNDGGCLGDGGSGLGITLLKS